MKTQLIHGARAAINVKDTELVLLYADAKQLEPVSLTVHGLEFDCLYGRLDSEDPVDVWAVDTSGYWMNTTELSGGICGALQQALREHLKREAAEPPRWADIESRLLAAGVPAFPGIRGGV
jgi:hypothetical protein